MDTIIDTMEMRVENNQGPPQVHEEEDILPDLCEPAVQIEESVPVAKPPSPEPGSVSPKVYFSKHKKGATLTAKEKSIILNVYSTFRIKNPKMTREEAFKKTAEFTGVSFSSVTNARSEFIKKGCLSTPNMKRPNAQLKNRRLERLDEFTKSVIWEKAHSSTGPNETPSIAKVHAELCKEPGIPPISRHQLYRILKDMGFCFHRQSPNASIRGLGPKTSGVGSKTGALGNFKKGWVYRPTV